MIIILFLLIACYSDATWASMVKQHSITQTDTKAEYTLQRKRALLEASCAGRALALTTILRENKTGQSMEISSFFPIMAQDGHKVTVSTESAGAQVCKKHIGDPQYLIEIFTTAIKQFLGRTKEEPFEPLHTEISEKGLTIDFNLKTSWLSICGIRPKLIELTHITSEENSADQDLLQVTIADSENS